MDNSHLQKIKSLFIITLIQRDDGQKDKAWRRKLHARVFKARMVSHVPDFNNRHPMQLRFMP